MTLQNVQLMEKVSAIVSFMSCIVFVIAIYRTRKDPCGVRPHRVTWLVLTGINAIMLWALYRTHQDIWFQASYLAGSSTVLICSIWRGTPGTSSFDRICLLLCLVAIGAWLLTGNLISAYFLAMAANAVSLLPTWNKAWRNPRSEFWPGWAIVVTGATINLAAALLGHVAGTGLANPIYFFVVSGITLVLSGPWRGAPITEGATQPE